jgi:uncharacterized membrane protein
MAYNNSNLLIVQNRRICPKSDAGLGLTRAASSGRLGNYYSHGVALMIIGILIAIVIVVVVGLMMCANSGKEGERRYCLKCGKTTWWHPKRGCEHCAWCERQW